MRDNEVAAMLARFDSPEEAIKSRQFLFHGTVESFTGPLKPGGYDGMIWTTNLPSVAQVYIPENGLSTLLHYDDFRGDDRVGPHPHNAWWTVVAKAMGADIEGAEPEFDASGALRSWRNCEGHPTYREAKEFLEAQGYSFEAGSCWLKTEYSDDEETLLPADFKRQGRLFILPREPSLNFHDLRDDEGDLMTPDHQRLDDFQAVKEAGYDGLIISDFAQSPRWGNVGHTSWGLFEHVVEQLPCLEVPAVAYDWEDRPGADGGITPDFRKAFEEIKLARSLSPSFG